MRSIISLLSIGLSSCTLTIHPPSSPPDPVSVLVVDYGRHSSLVLPTENGGGVEYAYGEWEWFAQANDAWYRAFPAMFWPTQGTLGRRFFAHPPESPTVGTALRAEARFILAVERGRADALRRRLGRRFEAASDSRHAHPLYGLTFVRDDRDYCFASDCNDVLEEWLEELGCDVSGSSCSARFQVVD